MVHHPKLSFSSLDILALYIRVLQSNKQGNEGYSTFGWGISPVSSQSTTFADFRFPYLFEMTCSPRPASLLGGLRHRHRFKASNKQSIGIAWEACSEHTAEEAKKRSVPPR